jgi:hypothetical protein
VLLLLLGPLPRSRRCDAAGAARAARPGPQAESSERPLRRRAARMARPARVRMRRRKPWVLARRRLFGWKVRLLTLISVTGGPGWSASAGGAVSSPAAIGNPRACHGHAKTADKAASTVRERAPQGQTSLSTAPADPRYQHAAIPSVADTPAIDKFSCFRVTNFVDQVARVVGLLLASPFGAPTVIPTGCG